MGLQAGIDEVGYGPTLGPLVATSVAFSGDRLPVGNLWKWLDPAVSADPGDDPHVTPVCDSKRLYHGPPTLPRLEAAVWPFFSLLGIRPGADWRELVERLAPGAVARLSRCPWYQDAGLRLPAQADPRPLRSREAALRAVLDRRSTRLQAVRTALLDAEDFNGRLGEAGNKARVLWGLVGGLLRELPAAAAPVGLFPADPARGLPAGSIPVPDRAEVGKQGGRRFYAEGLRDRFGADAVEVRGESRARACYRIGRPGGPLEVRFLRDGEDQSLPLALASLIGKYVREILMRLFNAWWSRAVPGLAPTAGYPTDAVRWLGVAGPHLRRLEVDPRILIRER